MCFGLTKIWRRKLKKPPANTAEKPISPWTSTTSSSTRAPASKPPSSLGLDSPTAVGGMDSSPVAEKKPLTAVIPSKPTPSNNYLSAPKPSYSSRTESHRSPSNSYSGGTASSAYGSASYGIGSSCGGSSNDGGCGESGGGGCGGGGGGCG